MVRASRRFVWVGGSVWVLADPRFIQFALGSLRCARQRIVNVMKVYIERNNYSSLRLWLSRVTRDHEWTNG